MVLLVLDLPFLQHRLPRDLLTRSLRRIPWEALRVHTQDLAALLRRLLGPSVATASARIPSSGRNGKHE